ncbi:MAG: S41 family peptidase [Cellvibrionaceae bacterium]|nr:S41 family peptidase [Cellvibrionaceae bacterium]
MCTHLWQNPVWRWRAAGHALLRRASQLLLAAAVSTAAVAQDQAAPASDAEAPLPLQQLRLFTLIFDHIRQAYVEPIGDQQLLENAVKGMLKELDPHSAFLDTGAYSALQETTQGEFSGLGLEITEDNGYIKIVTPIDETPADKAGLQAGDVIIKLDQQSLQGLNVSEAANRMRGALGTAVTLTIMRKGIDQPFDVVVVRGSIRLDSVRTRLIDDQFGYLRIAQFQADTGKEFTDALTALLESHQNLSGLILDLRNNPGGVLQASVEVADALLDEGLIVYTEGRLPNSDQSYSATAGDLSQGLPMVVLINGGSASAAEIVAGALQDSRRAVLMGTRSFGKGSVQTVLPLEDSKAIKLTTARYFTPSGRSIQAQGIAPDIIVKPATITQIDELKRLKEADLAGHLQNTEDASLSPEHKDSADAIEDHPLFEAINLLKGLAILARHQPLPATTD